MQDIKLPREQRKKLYRMAFPTPEARKDFPMSKITDEQWQSLEHTFVGASMIFNYKLEKMLSEITNEFRKCIKNVFPQ